MQLILKQVRHGSQRLYGGKEFIEIINSNQLSLLFLSSLWYQRAQELFANAKCSFVPPKKKKKFKFTWGQVIPEFWRLGLSILSH